MTENPTARFHEQLGGDALLSILEEAQNTVRSYDNKAQIVGVGYILALQVVLRSGAQVPVAIDQAGLYVFAGWAILVLPIIMFALVLYPSHADKVSRKRDFGGCAGAMYFDPRRSPDVDSYVRTVAGADWVRETACEIIKVSDIRDKKRARFFARAVLDRRLVRHAVPGADGARPGAGRAVDPRVFHADDSFNPAMPSAISPMQARRIAVAGSLNRKMPKAAAPSVPMPVHTA